MTTKGAYIAGAQIERVKVFIGSNSPLESKPKEMFDTWSHPKCPEIPPLNPRI